MIFRKKTKEELEQIRQKEGDALKIQMELRKREEERQKVSQDISKIRAARWREKTEKYRRAASAVHSVAAKIAPPQPTRRAPMRRRAVRTVVRKSSPKRRRKKEKSMFEPSGMLGRF